MDKNFGISTEDFERMVADLKKNETVFFKQVFLAHFKSCMDFLQKNNRATHDDAYDATMDTLIQFRQLLVEGKLHHGNLRYLFTRMASQIYLKNRRKFQSQELQEKDLLPAETDPVVNEERIDLLNSIWEELGAGCQELLKLHYYGKMKLKEIAESSDKTPEAIRKKKERCIEAVRAILKKNKITTHE